ncbi:MAG: cupin domain-containing protein [Chloroflexi bacterium]|nr:cupin domain-containing protein [Chloroflexota bacterium]
MPEVPALASVMVDNEDVRVTEWRFAPGTATGHHRHEFKYVVVPMTTGTLVIRSADGDVDNSIVAGSPYYREAGAEHNVVNMSDQEIVFIEIEMKAPSR